MSVRRRARARAVSLATGSPTGEGCAARPDPSVVHEPVRATPVSSPDGPVVRLGRAVTRGLHRLGIVLRGEVDVATARIRGAVVIGAAVLVLVSPTVAVVFALVGWHLPSGLAARRHRNTDQALRGEVLLAVELCAVSVHTGSTVIETLRSVAPYLPGALGDALARAVQACAHGALLDDRLSLIVSQLGEPVAPLVAILRAAHLDGDPIQPAIERLADRLRDERRRAVEVEVRKLSVRLLVPLVCCSLPGFVLIGIVPLTLHALGGLHH